MNNLNFNFDSKFAIAEAIDGKINEQQAPQIRIDPAALIHVERSSIARKLDLIGRVSPLTRTAAGAVRTAGGVGLILLTAPTFAFFKLLGDQDKMKDTKYYMGRGLDELMRGAQECVSLIYDPHLHDSSHQSTVVQFANGKYSHYSPDYPQCIVYTDDLAENEQPEFVRQASVTISVEGTPAISNEGTPHQVSPNLGPRGARSIFSRPGSPRDNAGEQESPDKHVTFTIPEDPPALTL